MVAKGGAGAKRTGYFLDQTIGLARLIHLLVISLSRFRMLRDVSYLPFSIPPGEPATDKRQGTSATTISIKTSRGRIVLILLLLHV